MMETRQQRGIELAKTGTIRHTGVDWIAPSQVGKGTYLVNVKE
ncbi:MAG: hypothetical protein WCA49_04475 [Candidatus Sulfotelmatobacter sp.]